MPKVPRVILLIETSRAYGRALLRGITKYSRLHGPWVFYSEPGGLEKALPYLKNWAPDGIIMRDSGKGDAVMKMKVPVIVTVHLKEHTSGTPYIDTNGVEIGRMAAEHLLNHGFQRFAFCGFDEIHWSRERGENFSKRIRKAGYGTYFYKRPRTKKQRLWENEQGIMVDWLKSLPKPIGLMACNDDRGRQLTEACKVAGLHVPEEVAIIGVDNDELVCELSDPPLSSVALDVERGGYEAAKLLYKLMEGKKVANQDVIIPPTHVVTRQSTDILAMEDLEVARAMRFIRQNAKGPIQVDEVVDATDLSRRALEQRFRKVLNRSVHDEIRRVRVEQVERMLLETNMSISQIAYALGYPGVNNVARYFRHEKGMSPLAFRRKYGNM